MSETTFTDQRPRTTSAEIPEKLKALKPLGKDPAFEQANTLLAGRTPWTIEAGELSAHTNKGRYGTSMETHDRAFMRSANAVRNWSLT